MPIAEVMLELLPRQLGAPARVHDRVWVVSARALSRALPGPAAALPGARFGTVRPRGQIRAPDQFLYSKPAISGVVLSRRITAGSQFPAELSLLGVR